MTIGLDFDFGLIGGAAADDTAELAVVGAVDSLCDELVEAIDIDWRTWHEQQPAYRIKEHIQ